MNQKELIKFVHTDAKDVKPNDLFMDEVFWKFLVHSVVTGKNIMMTGPAGCGKTKAANDVATSLGRELFYFNMGSTQDPRASLIGNTGFKDNETTFGESAFINAIKTPNAVILLDEFSRAHPEAHNILMSVVDPKQRYLRIDEVENSPVIKVADGVCFIATANIGTEYTATRAVDRAMWDRFKKVTMKVLDKENELKLLELLYPTVEKSSLEALAGIAHDSRIASTGDDAKLSDMISTRTSVEAGELMKDGFSLDEVAEVLFYPSYQDEELKHMKIIVQKYGKSDDEELYDGDSDEDVVPEF